MTKTFEMNGNAYSTDANTLALLKEVVQDYRDNGNKDASAVTAMMELGLKTKTIIELKDTLTDLRDGSKKVLVGCQNCGIPVWTKIGINPVCYVCRG